MPKTRTRILIFLSAFFLTLQGPLAKSRVISDPDLILVTAFEPFGGSQINYSEKVAREVMTRQVQIGSNVEVRLCVLPVEYDHAAEQALECLRNLPSPPKLILSLGEGDCTVRLETGVSNLDNTKAADNRGVTRLNSPILPGAPDRLGLSLPVPEMLCALDPALNDGRVRPSVTAGNYVCNNTAYRLAYHFRNSKLPYGFIHVPHSQCDFRLRDPVRNGAIIAQFLRTAYRRKDKFPLPSTKSEVQALLASSPTSPSNPSCYDQLLFKLLKEYR